MSKIRLDKFVQEKIGVAPAKAQALIIAGNILINEQKENKPGTMISAESMLRVLGETRLYVSRGGLKLEGAMKQFGISAQNKKCLDIGASTGGFTDYLLQNGATSVIALDVGYNQLDWKIRNDKKVTVIEECNFRLMNKSAWQWETALDLVVIDVSFISLSMILPPLSEIGHPGLEVVALVKPQFEANRDQVGKGGIIKDPAVHSAVVEKIKTAATSSGFTVLGTIDSSITGMDGNKEFFIWLKQN